MCRSFLKTFHTPLFQTHHPPIFNSQQLPRSLPRWPHLYSQSQSETGLTLPSPLISNESPPYSSSLLRRPTRYLEEVSILCAPTKHIRTLIPPSRPVKTKLIIYPSVSNSFGRKVDPFFVRDLASDPRSFEATFSPSRSPNTFCN